MNKASFCSVLGTVVLGLASLAFSGAVFADPPSRVARLAYTAGTVSFSPAGEDGWVRAAVNRPMTTGDRLWVDAGSRAELQMGGTVVHIDAGTSATVLALDDRVAQLQLAQGVLSLWVRSLEPDETLEVDTPNLAYAINRPGHYRIGVDADGSATTVTVQEGQAEVFGERAAFVIEQGQADRFYGTDLQDYETVAMPAPDDFDRWSAERDRRREASPSARYVSPDLIGYEDLDANGSWRTVAGYGNVWTPSHVAADWAPYHDGHWAWVDPWGWTWVDNADWGFAPSHYGRWANIGGAWGWIPGPVAVRPVYAPALVAFVGGAGAVAWFALGPHDVYRPSYPASRGYFNSVNTSNTVINTTNITNVYNNVNVTDIVYANRQVRGAVIAVPGTAFAQSRSVSAAALRMSGAQATAGPVVSAAPVAPARTSVLGGGAAAGARPPAAALVRAAVVKTAPPPVVPFAEMQKGLDAHPGRPLDAAAMAALRPAKPPALAVVKVAAQVRPVALPPRAAVAGNNPGRGPAMARPPAPVAVPHEASAKPPVTPAPHEAVAAAPPSKPVPREVAATPPVKPVAPDATVPPGARPAPHEVPAVPRPPEAAKLRPEPAKLRPEPAKLPPEPARPQAAVVHEPPPAHQAPPPRPPVTRGPVPVAEPVAHQPAAHSPPPPHEVPPPRPAVEPGKPPGAREPVAEARQREEQRKKAEEEAPRKP